MRALAERLRGGGLEIEPRVADLADEAQIDALIGGLPPLAALVNSAGLFDERKFLDVSPEDLRRMFEVNLIAAASLTQKAAARMAPGPRW